MNDTPLHCPECGALIDDTNPWDEDSEVCETCAEIVSREDGDPDELRFS